MAGKELAFSDMAIYLFSRKYTFVFTLTEMLSLKQFIF